ncbi:MAG: replicative DNA helicase [Victivallaceae bacterium]|nr:replicative DNA helicase [Victivallaceae bacterium]
MAEERTARDAYPVGFLPDRARPHAEAVEKAVLGAMLREPGSAVGTVIASCRQEQLFYSSAHQEIYRALLELHRDETRSVDLVSLAQYLREKQKLEAVGGEIYLAGLFDSIATTVNLESWCKTLTKYATLRRMIDVCAGALTRCYDGEADAAKLVDQIESDIYAIRNGEETHAISVLGDLLPKQFKLLMDILDRKIEPGIPTGFMPVDECTGGLKKGEMFVLAARPSIGKTSLALNVIRNITVNCPNPRAVAFFSLEMTDEQIARRLLCTQARVPESAFWNRNFKTSDMEKLTGAVQKLSKAPLYIDPTPGLTISELRAKARRLYSEKHIELIVIDYLQLMHSDGRVDSRQQEVAEISGGIKKIAKDLNIPVLVLAQLNRELDKDKGQNARPKLAHLRESGAIEQDADIVSFLHRDREKTKGMESGSVEAEWIIEKNRNGRTANCKLVFYPERMEFMAASPESSEYAPQQQK